MVYLATTPLEISGMWILTFLVVSPVNLTFCFVGNELIEPFDVELVLQDVTEVLEVAPCQESAWAKAFRLTVLQKNLGEERYFMKAS